MDVVLIQSEEDFLDAATKALAGELDLLTGIKFQGWPSLKLKVNGKRYNQTLPTNAMSGIVALQEAYNRAYAFAKYGTTNLQRLTEREKSDLEFVFKITNGSTDNQAETSDWLNAVIENVGNVMAGMDSIHKQRVLITLILVAGTYFVGSEIVEANGKKAAIEGSVALVSEVNKGHKQTIDSLLRLKGPDVSDIKALVGEGQVSFIKSVADAESVSFDGVKIERKAIQEIAKTSKAAKDKLERQSRFKIDGFKRSPEYLLFFVTDLKTEENYSLKVDVVFTKQDELDLIFIAMKDGSEIELSVDLVVRNGLVEKGRLIKVIAEKNGDTTSD